MFLDLDTFIVQHYPLSDIRFEGQFDTKGDRFAFNLAAAEGKFVVKLTYPNRPEAVVKRELAVLNFLAAQHFPAPAPVASKSGAFYLPFHDRFVYLYPYIEGRNPVPSASFYTQLGLTLARLHSLPAGSSLAASENTPANIFREIKPFLEDIHDPQQVVFATEMLETIHTFPDFSGLPVGLIHTDPYFVNLIVDPQGRLYLIDWDDTGISTALLDVGYVIAHLCTFTPREQEQWQITPRARIAWKADWARLFLDAYQSVRPLTGDEKALLPHAALFNMIEYIQDWDTHSLIEDNCLRYRILKGEVNLLFE